MRRNPASERLQFITAVVLYGTIGLFLRSVHLPSEIVALCRGVIGSGFIYLYQRIRGKRLDRAAVKKNLGWLLLSGACLGLNWIFLFMAYLHTTVAIASLCNYMAPIIVILLAPFALHEKIERRKIPCVAAAFVGIVLVSDVFGRGLGSLSGVAMGLAAAACFVGIILCNRKLRDIEAMDRVIVQLAASAATVLPYVLVRNVGAPITVDTQSVLIILLLGFVHTGLAYCFWFSGMGSLPVQTIAILGYLEPVVSVLCSVIFLHESMGAAGWIGTVLILGAAVVSETIGEKKSA
ncbi:MAG: DMT family transporter [Oscillospiraceae bacterium]|nr:DMT family transporter [Oscillospiraceae bacterium]